MVDEDVGEATQFDTVFDEEVLLSINPSSVSFYYQDQSEINSINCENKFDKQEKVKNFLVH